MGKYRVYIIVNKEGRRYIGLSEDICKRLDDHNAGVLQWTARRGPWSLTWCSCEMSLVDARGLESKMKHQKGGAGLLRLMEEYGSPSGS